MRPSRRACCSVCLRPFHTSSTAPTANTAITAQCDGPYAVNFPAISTHMFVERELMCQISGKPRSQAHVRLGLASDDHRRTVAEQSLIGGDADGGALDLATGGLALQLPRQLTYLRDGLRRDRLPETGQPARRVDRDAAADRRCAAAQQLLGLTPGAQAKVLIPIQLQRGGQVVNLGEAEVFGSDACLGVGRVEDLILERPLRRR